MVILKLEVVTLSELVARIEPVARIELVEIKNHVIM